MPTLPNLSGRDIIRAFERDGWEKVRQRGSHVVLVKEGSMATLSVPDHKEVAKGTLRRLRPRSGL
ncbi:MAG: type II toxin-antitoxin system HicA family toxin, partial [Okeania sp. SIO3B3]|nr:type II toxin-antitoxin system HicA family toxin [Okeania sp. SIO3B3]